MCNMAGSLLDYDNINFWYALLHCMSIKCAELASKMATEVESLEKLLESAGQRALTEHELSEAKRILYGNLAHVPKYTRRPLPILDSRWANWSSSPWGNECTGVQNHHCYMHA